MPLTSDWLQVFWPDSKAFSENGHAAFKVKVNFNILILQNKFIYKDASYTTHLSVI